MEKEIKAALILGLLVGLAVCYELEFNLIGNAMDQMFSIGEFEKYAK